MRNKAYSFVVVLFLLAAARCKDDGVSNGESQGCTEQACFGQCAATKWADLTESYWAFEASCRDDDTCLCVERCNDELCDEDYCQGDLKMAGGSCGMLVCECYGEEDAGDGGDS